MRVTMNYVQKGGPRPYYYANAHEKDFVPIDPQGVEMLDGRPLTSSVDIEGFQLLRHPSKVTDFSDHEAIAEHYNDEVLALVRKVSGADEVALTGRTIHRFSEKSGLAGSQDNSHPARFAHIDISGPEAAGMTKQPLSDGKQPRRVALFNVWRSVAGGTQDVPLAFCDSRSVRREDCVEADAHFDGEGPKWTMEAWAIAHSPDHRWYYFPDMSAEEAVIFKTYDSDAGKARFVAHGAFDNPLAPADCAPRHSLETRVRAMWR